MKGLNDFICDPSLVFYAPLWKKDSSVFQSEDVYGHQCTRVGALWTPQGHSFDSAHDDYITIPDHDSLDGFTAGMTLICWVKRSEAGVSHALIRKYETTDNQRSYIFTIGADNKVTVTISKNGTTDTDQYSTSTSTGTITDTNFHHLAVVWIPAAFPVIYIDGAVAAVTTAGVAITTIKAGTAPFTLGYTSTSLYGVMREAWTFNRGFSPIEIQNHLLASRRY